MISLRRIHPFEVFRDDVIKEVDPEKIHGETAQNIDLHHIRIDLKESTEKEHFRTGRSTSHPEDEESR